MKSTAPDTPKPSSVESQLAETVLSRCAALGACTDQDGTIQRTFLSPAMERCHQLVEEWMKSAGMLVSVDQAGNLRGVYESAQPDAPRLLLGSHLDTVPDAGKYDGILGVMLGITLVDSLQGKRMPFAIEVIGFSDEEGVRYGLPFIGSLAVTGRLSLSHKVLLDTRGITLDAALDTFAATHPRVIPARLHPCSSAYLEFHIEQGPVLEASNQALGVVEAIAGQSRANLHVSRPRRTRRHYAHGPAARCDDSRCRMDIGCRIHCTGNARPGCEHRPRCLRTGSRQYHSCSCTLQS